MSFVPAKADKMALCELGTFHASKSGARLKWPPAASPLGASPQEKPAFVISRQIRTLTIRFQYALIGISLVSEWPRTDDCRNDHGKDGGRQKMGGAVQDRLPQG